MNGKNFIISASFLFCALLLFFHGCNKKTEAVPDFPQLIGQWSGTTSQNTTITLSVNSKDGILRIKKYTLLVYTIGTYQTYENYNYNGIVSVINKQFSVSIGTGQSGPAFLDGTFDEKDLFLTGNFAVYAKGNNIDKITGDYTAGKTQ